MCTLFVGVTLWQGYDKWAVKMELSIKLLARRSFRSLALINLQFNDDTFLLRSFLFKKFLAKIFGFFRILGDKVII